VTAPGPALTIVLTGRNDNYGGDFNARLFRTLRFNHERLAEAGLSHEFVFVEWNPVPGQPTLASLLAREVDLLDTSLRRFVVDSRYHAAFSQGAALDYLEYIAKNAGIRRARGTCVLATNTDIFLSRGVVRALATGTPAAGTLYRAARFDLKLGADQTGIDWAGLEDARNHVRAPELRPPLFSGGSGDFALLDRETFRRLRGYNEVYRLARVGIDYNFLVKAHSAGVPIVDIGAPVYHVNHVGSFRLSKRVYRDAAAEGAWGKRTWHSHSVVYENPDTWGLGGAPERPLADGSTLIDFAWDAVPPLIDLRRVLLPLARGGWLAADDADQADGAMVDGPER
jgi:hypothetical protein